MTDNGCNSIRKITPQGVVSTLAGSASESGSLDGDGATARFGYLTGITRDKLGNLYVVDHDNRTIRKIVEDPNTKKITVSTVAGDSSVFCGYPYTVSACSADGTGTAARFNTPASISVDQDLNLYVTDYENRNIRKITLSGEVTTFLGKMNEAGQIDGPAAVARFGYPQGISVAPNGHIYVGDLYTLREIGPGYTISGKVTGLQGALVLTNNNGDSKTLDSQMLPVDGSFTLDLPVASGKGYTVSVNPPLGQTCTVTGGDKKNGSGTATAHVTDIAVTCTGAPTVAYRIGGTVSGLNGTLKLQNSDNGDTVSLTANAPFTFTKTLALGSPYTVSVAQNLNGQTCIVNAGAGTVAGDVNNIAVTCAASTYNISAQASGLNGTLVLKNGTENLTLISPGTSAKFPTQVTHGGAYNVIVQTQPTGQSCTSTTLGSPAAGNAMGDVTVMMGCVNYTIGGNVSNLPTGQSVTLTLQDTAAATPATLATSTLSSNGTFTFDPTVTVKGAYNITAVTQPAGQTCAVTGGSSAVAPTANVNAVAVDCTPPPASFTVGGVVKGLNITGLILVNNDSDFKPIFPATPPTIPPADVPFTFTTQIAVNGTYSVVVDTLPPSATQTCSVTSGGMGTVSNANITNVVVTCTDVIPPTGGGGGTCTPPLVFDPVTNACIPVNGGGAAGFSIGGTVSITMGTVTLQNGADTLPNMGNGTFVFPTPVNGTYNVTYDPTSTAAAGLTCTVTNGTGTATANVGNVSNVSVVCQ